MQILGGGGIGARGGYPPFPLYDTLVVTLSVKREFQHEMMCSVKVVLGKSTCISHGMLDRLFYAMHLCIHRMVNSRENMH